MKHIIEFELPDESQDLERAMNGWKYSRVIDDFDNWLRYQIKYQELQEDDEKLYQIIRDKFYEIKIETFG